MNQRDEEAYKFLLGLTLLGDSFTMNELAAVRAGLGIESSLLQASGLIDYTPEGGGLRYRISSAGHDFIRNHHET